MGKAIIQSHAGSGLYNVAIQYDNTRVQARLALIAVELVKIDPEIVTAQADYDEQKTASDAKLAEMNAYMASPGHSLAQLMKLTNEAMAARIETELAERKLRILQLRKTAMQKEQADLQTNAPDSKNVQAWCADISESLSGTVGTVEMDYETHAGQNIILLPGHAAAGGHQATYSAARDGIIHHPHDQTPHQMYTNRAWLPAQSKWKPRYRVGSITSLSGNLCNVMLDNAKSSQQELEINQATALSSVPIVYMTCHGAAFMLGDRVVVAFDGDWATPTVIGFESNPRVCPGGGSGPNFTAASDFGNTRSGEKAANWRRRIVTGGTMTTYVWYIGSDSLGDYQKYVIYAPAYSERNINHFEQDYKIGSIYEPESRPTIHIEYDSDGTTSFTGTLYTRTTISSASNTYTYQTPIDSLAITSTQNGTQTITYTYGSPVYFGNPPNIESITITASSETDVKTVLHMSYVDPVVGINAYTYKRVVTSESGTQSIDSATGNRTASGGTTVTTYYITVYDDGRTFSQHSNGFWYEDVVAFSEIFIPYSTEFTPYDILYSSDLVYAPNDPPTVVIPSSDTTISPTSGGLIGPTEWPAR